MLLRRNDLLSLKTAWRSAGIAALFALFTFAFFWRILFSEGVYFPVARDFASFNYPQNVFGATSLTQGEVPVWNPYLSTGQPYAADPNIGFFYPLKVLLVLALRGLSYKQMEYFIILHYFISGVLMYILARELDASKVGGVVAGLAYMFSGFLIGQMEHPNIIVTTTWFALVFVFFRRAIISQHAGDAVLAGLFLGISVLGGHPQFSFLMILWIGLWMMGRWADRLEFRQKSRALQDLEVKLPGAASQKLACDVGLFTLTLFIATAVAAVQILPALELIRESIRGGMSAEDATLSSLPPVGWITLVLPHFFGWNAVQAEPFWTGPATLNELYGYVGIVTLFLAALGLVRQHTYDARFLVAIAGLAIIMASGNFTPLYGIVYRFLPGFQMMRVPARFLYWFDLSLPLLAAFGIDYFRRLPKGSGKNLWRVSIIAIAALWVAAFGLRLAFQLVNIPERVEGLTAVRMGNINGLIGLLSGILIVLVFHRLLKSSRRLLTSLVVGLVALDLFMAQGTFSFTTHNHMEGFEHPEVTALWNREGSPLYRVDASSETVNIWEPLTGLIHPMPMAFGLPWNPFDLSKFTEYWQVINRDGRAYDFLSVKYLIVPHDTVLSSKWKSRPVVDPTVQVYENTRVLPRAFMVYHSIVEADSQKALAIIQNGALDMGQTVLLESGTPLSNPPADSDVQIVSSNNNGVVLHTRTSEEGYLVMSDAFYPGWRAWVDDRGREVLRANYAFRAVYVPEGTHTVRFEFDSLPWRIGLTVTVLTCAGLSLAGAAFATMSLKARRVA